MKKTKRGKLRLISFTTRKRYFITQRIMVIVVLSF